MPAELIQMPSRSIAVTARPSPLSVDIYRAEFPMGSSIRDMVGPETRPLRVEIGGLVIPEEMWDTVKPEPAMAVVITAIPQGGSVKNIFRLVAFAALAVGVAAISAGALVVPYLTSSGTISSLFYAGSMSANLLAAGVGLTGALLINALIPPQTPNVSSTGGSTDLLKSITGTQNQLVPYGTIGVAMGVVKVFPTYAAKPYTELLGDDQYLRCLFDCGAGDPLVSDMRIGDTDISEYTDVETEISTDPSLFSQDVEEVAVTVTMNDDGDTATRTTAGDANEGSVDLANASGLFGLDSAGNVVGVTQVVEVAYAPHGSSSFTALMPGDPGYTLSSSAATANSDGTISITNAARKAVRVGVRWTFPSPGQYDVRVTRVSTNWGTASSDTRVGDMTWTVIRTIRTGSVSTTGTKKIAVRIKANDQLNGSLSTFNCILSQQIPVWHSESSSWVTEVSDNPSWIYRWLLKDCPANAKRVDTSRLDDDDVFIDFANACDAKGLGFNTYVDSPTTIFAMAKDVLAAGRATFNVNDGKYSLVQDVAQDVPVQVFTPRNSWGFGGTRAFPDAIHALRMQFINPGANWQQDERVVYDDGYGDADMVAANPSLTLATKFEVMQIRGCTDSVQVWRLGRYYLANGRLRHTTYYWSADPEHLVCRRGKLVKVANDVIGVGTGWGRITRVADDGTYQTAISLDESVIPLPGKIYGVRVRLRDGSVFLSQVNPHIPQRNMLDPNAVTKDYAVKTTDGTLAYVPQAYASDYIPVQPGQTYILTGAITWGPGVYGMAYFDDGKHFAGAGPVLPYSSGPTVFTVPANTFFLRMTGVYAGSSSPDLATQMLLLGSTAPSSYIPFNPEEQKVNYLPLNFPRLIDPEHPDTNINEGDLFLFGEMFNDSLDLIVTKIEPGDDFTAKITAVEAAPDVLAADEGSVPSWTSQITGQVQDPAPEPPSEVTVTSQQILSPSDDGGITLPVMMIAVYGPWSGARKSGHVTVDHIEIRYRQADPVGPWTAIVLPYGERSTTVSDITRGIDYQIEARAVAASGATSLWTAADHTTSTADRAPDTPGGVSLTTGYQYAGIQWSPVSQADVTYEVGLYTASGSGGSPPADGDYAYFGVGSALQYASNVSPDTTTYYRVRARTFAGVASDPSDPVSWYEPPAGP